NLIVGSAGYPDASGGAAGNHVPVTRRCPANDIVVTEHVDADRRAEVDQAGDVGANEIILEEIGVTHDINLEAVSGDDIARRGGCAANKIAVVRDLNSCPDVSEGGSPAQRVDADKTVFDDIAVAAKQVDAGPVEAVDDEPAYGGASRRNA